MEIMNKEDLEFDNTFKVRESQLINYLFAFLSLAMCIGAFITISSAPDHSFYAYRPIVLLTLFPAIIFFIKAIKKKILLELNMNGVYYQGNLITTWANFVRSYAIQEEVPGSLDDNVRIVVEYYVPEKEMNYVIKLNLKSTQDKSEEQIIAAMTYFVTLRNQ